MAGEQHRPDLSNVILFARLGCHMITRLEQWNLDASPCLVSERQGFVVLSEDRSHEGLRKQITMSQSRRDSGRFRCALGKTPN